MKPVNPLDAFTNAAYVALANTVNKEFGETGIMLITVDEKTGQMHCYTNAKPKTARAIHRAALVNLEEGNFILKEQRMK